MARARWFALGVVGVVSAVLLAVVPPAEGQGRGTAPAGPAPRAADGKPDFSGFWDWPHAPGGPARGATVFDSKRFAPFKPAARRSSTSRGPATRATTSRARSACRRASRRTCSARIPCRSSSGQAGW